MSRDFHILTYLFVVITIMSIFKTWLLFFITYKCMCLQVGMCIWACECMSFWKPEFSDLWMLELEKAVSHLPWVLGTEVGTSVQASSTLHQWATSTLPSYFYEQTGWSCCSVAQQLPSTCEVLGSVLIDEKGRKKNREGGRGTEQASEQWWAHTTTGWSLEL